VCAGVRNYVGRVQHLDLQLHALRSDGCARIYREKLTGRGVCRPALNAALKHVSPGDMLVVWKLDRLGRSLQHLIEIIQELERRGIGFRSLSDAIDTTSPGGRLLFHVMGAIAEFEAALISERTKAGLAAARRKGKRLGRPRRMSNALVEEARMLRENGDLSLTDVAARLNVGRTTLWRALSTL
jgi:DNA invertase Pin-like site-specific DNA recombinase